MLNLEIITKRFMSLFAGDSMRCLANNLAEVHGLHGKEIKKTIFRMRLESWTRLIE
jgi:hypothetical protein